MRVVAGTAFAILSRLMLYLRLFQEIVVAAKTNLPLISLHLDRKTRLVTLSALLVFVGRMRIKVRLGRRNRRSLHWLGPIQGAPVFVVDNRRGISLRTRRWDTIKKEV